MKTKPILLLILLSLIFMQGAKAQQYEFAPIGAKWYYTLADNSIPYPHTLLKFIKIVSSGDTVIDGISCRILEEFRTPVNNYDNNLYLSNTHYVFSDSSKVFYYNTVTESFDILYDFSKEQGDYWLSYGWGTSPDCDTVKVEATGSIQVNGHHLKTLSVTQPYCMAGFLLPGYQIIEAIGHVGYLFPLADFSPEGTLRCYEDSVLGLYSTGIVPECDYIGLASMNENTKFNTIHFYPNPVSDFLHIQVNFPEAPIQITLTDITGRVVHQSAFNNRIDVSHLPEGLYLLSVQTKAGQFNQKVIVQ